MSLRTLALAAVGLALVTLSGAACRAILIGELYFPALFAIFVGGLVAGACPLALAVFRLWRWRTADAWPNVAQAGGLIVSGTTLALGGCGSWMWWSDDAASLAPVMGAVFFFGIALTIGAATLLARAANGPDSNQ